MDLIDAGHRGVSRAIDLTRVRVVGFVAARGPVRPATIVAELGMTKSAVSRHLAALEEAGHISVDDDPHDARTFLAHITEAGRADVAATNAAGAARFAEVVADWSDEDIAVAHSVTERLRRAWTAAPPPETSAPAPRWRRRRPLNPQEDR